MNKWRRKKIATRSNSCHETCPWSQKQLRLKRWRPFLLQVINPPRLGKTRGISSKQATWEIPLNISDFPTSQTQGQVLRGSSSIDPRDIHSIVMITSREEPPYSTKSSGLRSSKAKKKLKQALLLLLNLPDHEEKEGRSSYTTGQRKLGISTSVRQIPTYVGTWRVTTHEGLQSLCPWLRISSVNKLSPETSRRNLDILPRGLLLSNHNFSVLWKSGEEI